MNWFLITALICGSLTISDVAHLFMGLRPSVYLLLRNVYTNLLFILKSNWFFVVELLHNCILTSTNRL